MPDKPCIVISSAGRRMVKTALQYARKTITEEFMTDTKLCLIGPSDSTRVAEEEVQDFLRRFIHETGRKLMACKGSSDEHCVTDELKGLGIEVDYHRGSCVRGHPGGLCANGLVRRGWLAHNCI